MPYIDKLTKQSFIPKRLDQKFATRENQIKYNNLKQRNKRILRSKVDRILHKNHEICLGVLGDKNSVIKSKEWLDALGYNFAFSTHFYDLDEAKNPIPAVYDIAIQTLPNQKYKITRHESY